MVDSEKKGFFKRVADYYGIGPEPEPAAPIQVRGPGSVASFGGDSPLPGVLPQPLTNLDELTVNTALSMSAVYRSVDIITTSVSQLELGVWRGINEMRSVPAIVSRPDTNTSPSSFLKKTTMSLATTGNAYWRVYRNDAGSPVQNLEVLNPQAITIRYDDNGNKFYDYAGYDKPMSFKAWQIKHLKLMEVFGTEFGLGPIQAAQSELRENFNLRHYGNRVFSEYPSGIVSTKDYLDAEMGAAYKQAWYRDEATGQRVKFLGNGMTYQPLLLNPADAQFLETQAFSITQVARLFGIPANYLLAEINGNAMTYQNMESVDTAFVKYTLTGYLREIEEAFTDLLPRGQRARFKVEGFLRSDDKTRAEVNKHYKEMGVLSAEEIRIAEGWGPMPEELKNPVPTAAPGIPQEADNEDV